MVSGRIDYELVKGVILMDEQQRINTILKKLENEYSLAKTALNFTNPLQLLIATILSAQCTDERVNQTTSLLFKKYKTVEDYAQANVDELSAIIKPCGLYHNKSRFIINACQKLLEDFNGEVPETRGELQCLPGVGRKTANVVISNIFNKQAIAVDTHVYRVSRRLGLAKSDKVRLVEDELMALIPQHKWSEAHHWLIYHGRQVCKARKPLCEECFLQEECHFYQL